MPRIRLFGPAAELAGTRSDVLAGERVEDVLAAANARYGAQFARLAKTCRIWVNGEAADGETALRDDDEVAVLPPVSGGA